MTNIVENNCLLGPEQYGFRRGRSTIDAVMVLTALLQKAKRKSWPYSAAFIDISKVHLILKYEYLNYFSYFSGLR